MELKERYGDEFKQSNGNARYVAKGYKKLDRIVNYLDAQIIKLLAENIQKSNRRGDNFDRSNLCSLLFGQSARRVN